MKVTKTGAIFKKGAIKNPSQEAIDRTLDYGIGIIKEDTPVDTGRLEEGWYKGSNDIINDVPYVDFVEEGTRYMIGTGMVRRNLGRIEKFFLKAIKDSIIDNLQ